jgi:hypothetical protein
LELQKLFLAEALNLAVSIISKQLLSRQWDKKYDGNIFLERKSFSQRFTKTKTSPKRILNKKDGTQISYDDYDYPLS